LVDVQHHTVLHTKRWGFTESQDFQFSVFILPSCNGSNLRSSYVKAYNDGSFLIHGVLCFFVVFTDPAAGFLYTALGCLSGFAEAFALLLAAGFTVVFFGAGFSAGFTVLAAGLTASFAGTVITAVSPVAAISTSTLSICGGVGLGGGVPSLRVHTTSFSNATLIRV
jgi:hypothetical protein